MRRVSVSERRDRLGLRHLLSTPADTVEQVASGLVVLHATDPPSVYLSAMARVAEPDLGAVERALYDDRSLVRLLAMRRTIFVVAREMVPVVEASSTAKIASAERRKLVKTIEGSDLGPGQAWLDRAAEQITEALARSGEATARELAEAAPLLASELIVGKGTRHEARKRATTQVLALLAAEGHLQRARPSGTWVGSQYRWTTRADWIGQDDQIDITTAQATLASKLLHAYGPMSTDDMKWWTGWTVAETQRALGAIEAVEVALEGPTDRGWLLPEDLEPVEPGADWVALLPALDPTPMGWKERDWYLGGHRDELFDRTGNVGPTAWWNGRVVGGWAVTSDKTVAVELLEDVGSEAAERFEAEASTLTDLLDSTVVTPKFRTPLERRLAS